MNPQKGGTKHRWLPTRAGAKEDDTCARCRMRRTVERVGPVNGLKWVYYGVGEDRRRVVGGAGKTQDVPACGAPRPKPDPNRPKGRCEVKYRRGMRCRLRAGHQYEHHWWTSDPIARLPRDVRWG